MTITSTSPEQTQKLGERIASLLKAGDVLALDGDLGSGKTTFIQGIMAGFGIRQRVTSPTFVLLKMYITPNNMPVFHFDLYRLANDQALKEVGFEEIVNESNAISLIEWSQKATAYLPKKTQYITSSTISDTERTFVSTAFNDLSL